MALRPKHCSRTRKLSYQSRQVLFLVAEFVVGFFRKYLRFRVWLLGLVLLVLVLTGKLVAGGGLVMASIIILYVVLSYLDRWFENHEQE